ncbi:uracil phosphoribosyltransferase [Candidatus Laterigemmans baculatus]|uniref:uracil phosphoribosyltransferase n=1 Tax=Candidatus Laterigemmans baculatus TaxID=2770505 RepID=UPI0013DAFDD0|nr:uracil phosphoribosyltransferase [Candidatus Laterigemmans baculatus]
MTNERVHCIAHPLAAHHLRIIRDASTPTWQFRSAVDRLAMLLGVYATEDLKTRETVVTTPLAKTAAQVLTDRIGLVPILRAGLGLVDPLLQLLPEAEVWHLGLYRNEETATPVRYYDKLPATSPVDIALVLDPMLATGGSVRLVVERLAQWGVPDIRVVSVIAAQPGLDRVRGEFPQVRFFVGAIDPELNARQFIVPGLGDAGDRIFNTPSA